NQWLVFAADFSIKSNTRSKVLRFLNTYKDYFDREEVAVAKQMIMSPTFSQIDTLECLIDLVQSELKKAEILAQHPLKNVKGILLLADEYDTAYNTEYLYSYHTMSERERILYRQKAANEDFWKAIKGYTAMIPIRGFITGVNPVFFYDIASG